MEGIAKVTSFAFVPFFLPFSSPSAATLVLAFLPISFTSFFFFCSSFPSLFCCAGRSLYLSPQHALFPSEEPFRFPPEQVPALKPSSNKVRGPLTRSPPIFSSSSPAATAPFYFPSLLPFSLRNPLLKIFDPRIFGRSVLPDNKLLTFFSTPTNALYVFSFFFFRTRPRPSCFHPRSPGRRRCRARFFCPPSSTKSPSSVRFFFPSAYLGLIPESTLFFFQF